MAPPTKKDTRGRLHIDAIMIGFKIALVAKTRRAFFIIGNNRAKATKNMALERDNDTVIVSALSFPVAIPSTTYVARIYMNGGEEWGVHVSQIGTLEPHTSSARRHKSITYSKRQEDGMNSRISINDTSYSRKRTQGRSNDNSRPAFS
jgi:hypothetical protein